MNAIFDARQLPELDIRPFIDGQFVASTSTEHFDKVNPATETVLCTVPVGCAEDVDRAVAVARQRFAEGGWSRMAPAGRQAVLMKLADLIEQHHEELAALDTLEMGKPIGAAKFDSSVFGPTYLRSWAGFIDKLNGEVGAGAGTTLEYNVFEPRGVVGAITPWNFPLVNAVFKIGPALAAGNSVVLKPSELSSGSALKLAQLAVEAGVPAGVLNVVPGLGETVGAALASHMDVNLLSFTGSTLTGRRIMTLCGQSNGKPMLMECGGKSPEVVFGDIEDLDALADALQGMFWNQGQVCSAHTRLIVHESIKDELLAKIVERASALTPGDPWDENTGFGPLASPVQRDRVKGFLEQGLAAGAKAVLGGLDSVQSTGGCFVSPTIFDQVTTDMSIWQEEIFGPVLCVHGFTTDDEALALANSTEFGLAATVWTRDLGRAKRFARDIRAGHVIIRTGGEVAPESGVVLGAEPQGASGYGAEVGLRGLQAYSALKGVVMVGA